MLQDWLRVGEGIAHFFLLGPSYLRSESGLKRIDTLLMHNLSSVGVS